MIRMSAGTAACLGLKKIRMAECPTTAYLLWGDDCSMKCAFCPQGQDSRQTDRLGRINWPAFSLQELGEGLAQADEAGVKRICLQGVRAGTGMSAISALLQEVTARTDLPACISAWVSSEEEVAALFQVGADRVSIAVDVVNGEAYARYKGGSQDERKKLLVACARRWPGRISTHLIFGLGETEEEMLALISELFAEKITAALFSFAPLRGTRLARHPRPDGSAYRRIQAAHYLLRHGHLTFDLLRFHQGRLASFGLPFAQAAAILQDGDAFRTSGCHDCNRPYYNESPGSFIYNYPRPLTAAEAKAALACLAAGMPEGGNEYEGEMSSHL